MWVWRYLNLNVIWLFHDTWYDITIIWYWHMNIIIHWLSSSLKWRSRPPFNPKKTRMLETFNFEFLNFLYDIMHYPQVLYNEMCCLENLIGILRLVFKCILGEISWKNSWNYTRNYHFGEDCIIIIIIFFLKYLIWNTLD